MKLVLTRALAAADYVTVAPTASTGRALSCCSWFCNTKKTQSFICTGRWKERRQKDKKQKWKMTIKWRETVTRTHWSRVSSDIPNQKQIFMQDGYRPHLKIRYNFFPKIIIKIIFTSYNFICVTSGARPTVWEPLHYSLQRWERNLNLCCGHGTVKQWGVLKIKILAEVFASS